MLLIDNTDITEIAGSVTLKSQWNNGASTLSFEYPAEKHAGYPNGCTVVFSEGGVNLFYGFLFKTSHDSTARKCVCYDQLRYLKSSGDVMRQVQTLDSFVNDVCIQAGDRIRVGTLDKTEVKLGKYFFGNKTHLDMLYQSIQDNLLMNGYYYTLRDNFGAIELRDTFDLRLPLVIGDGSLATDFEYENSIDEDTYNYIKVAADDKDKGVRNAFVVQNDASVAQFGRLALYHKITTNLNEAQMGERAQTLLKLKNKETETLSVECRGDPRIMAGNGVKVEIAGIDINTWAVVGSAQHSFGKSGHTMKLNLLFGR